MAFSLVHYIALGRRKHTVFFHAAFVLSGNNINHSQILCGTSNVQSTIEQDGRGTGNRHSLHAHDSTFTLFMWGLLRFAVIMLHHF